MWWSIFLILVQFYHFSRACCRCRVGDGANAANTLPLWHSTARGYLSRSFKRAKRISRFAYRCLPTRINLAHLCTPMVKSHIANGCTMCVCVCCECLFLCDANESLSYGKPSCIMLMRMLIRVYECVLFIALYISFFFFWLL